VHPFAQQFTPLPSSRFSVELSAERAGGFAPALGAALILLDGAGRGAPSPGPLYADTPERRPGAEFDRSGRLDLSLDDLPAGVERLLYVLYAAEEPSLLGLGRVRAAAGVFELDTRERGEAALILFEWYRRGGTWRLFASGQSTDCWVPRPS